MKTTMKKYLTRVLVMAAVLCLLAVNVLPAQASNANTAVTDARNGVVQVNLEFRGTDNESRILWSCSGVLVNDNTVITSHSVLTPEGAELEASAAAAGMTTAEYKGRLSVSVTVYRDNRIPATIVSESHDMDWAILRLSQSMHGRTPLKIRPSADVNQTENVYVIGFPTINVALQTYSTFVAEDATIVTGKVNKVAIGQNQHSFENTDYIQSSCPVDIGIIGGPMVDENGFVVGIAHTAYLTENNDTGADYYNAIAIDQITTVMKTLGIVYEEGVASEPTPVVTEPAPVVTEPAPVVTEPAPTQAPVVVPTVPDVVEPADTDEGMSATTIILIVAGVAVVAVILIVVMMLSKGKKKSQPGPAPIPTPVPTPSFDTGRTGFAPSNPTMPISDAGETSVLSQGAGETTVLSNNVNGGVLIRKRNNETVKISSDKFVIGRERSSVNYCITDNSSIGRTHAMLTVRNGVTYLTDLSSRNGTFVNGVKVFARQEIALKNGDKITLADEDLEYKL